MKRSNLDPATKADIVRFVKLLIDEALDHEFDPTFLEEDQEFPDDEDAQETDWSFKHGQY